MLLPERSITAMIQHGAVEVHVSLFNRTIHVEYDKSEEQDVAVSHKETSTCVVVTNAVSASATVRVLHYFLTWTKQGQLINKQLSVAELTGLERPSMLGIVLFVLNLKVCF